MSLKALGEAESDLGATVMLVSFWDHRKVITGVPFRNQYATWMSRLSADEIAAIKAEMNAMIDTGRIHTSSWMPGSDWSSTVFQPIYLKAARRDHTAAAQFFGLMLMEVFMDRPETWTSEHFEKDGEPIKGRTYFTIGGSGPLSVTFD